ncbi:hypothetical protein NQ314_002996 [Rhamnusium bicolor]|uniref:DRBM domain-containing protein n=1 Tax=Rhamnusium bicolor TaxID=1586634 RepID=A0AAV8ZPZ3_9CUCU|nr:hypothetical protein NQ314_002996 [Rhamnusium bicolor]
MNKTPVSILQELMVQRKEHMPDYIIENSDRPGDFKCTVKICGYEVFDFASTKQQAKQNSAKKALLLLGVNNVGQQSSSAIKQQNELYINYVGKLNEFASTHKKSYPIYCDNIVHLNGNFVTQCNFMKWTTEGYGPKKKDSKQDAARMMLEK